MTRDERRYKLMNLMKHRMENSIRKTVKMYKDEDFTMEEAHDDLIEALTMLLMEGFIAEDLSQQEVVDQLSKFYKAASDTFKSFGDEGEIRSAWRKDLQ